MINVLDQISLPYQSFRFFAFLLSLLVWSSLERVFPLNQNKRPEKSSIRMISNSGLLALFTIFTKVLIPLTLIDFASWVGSKNLGFFNLIDFGGARFVIEFFILDLSIYAQHFISHKVPLLWRVHQVHHTDLFLDATSALRFHPIEMFLSLVYKAGVIMIFGISVEVVMIFEVILSSLAIFNHADFKISESFEKKIRYIFVTPAMHIIHHSTKSEECNSNFGFNFSFWDRLFGTYLKQANKGLVLGLDISRTEQSQSLLSLLLLPFKNRRGK